MSSSLTDNPTQGSLDDPTDSAFLEILSQYRVVRRFTGRVSSTSFL